MTFVKIVLKSADSEHCFDLSGLISTVGVTDIYLRQYIHTSLICVTNCDLSELALTLTVFSRLHAQTHEVPTLYPAFSQANGLGREFFCR